MGMSRGKDDGLSYADWSTPWPVNPDERRRCQRYTLACVGLIAVIVGLPIAIWVPVILQML